ncbi:MAG: PKD domain-containing protein, partial [Bacteroidales bacterium]|nr:PKD domain-containing protein [Bacteroidales bacterium]
MKQFRLLSIIALAVLLFSSCAKEPVASFTVDSSAAFVGDELLFTCTGYDYYSVEWDFGDGTTSTEPTVSHSYEKAGSYTVVLTCFSKNKSKTSVYSEAVAILPRNEIRYNGKSYPITNGQMIDYGNGRFVVYLYSDFYWDSYSQELFGKGTGILMGLVSASSSTLSVGTYQYSDSGNVMTVPA